jgi:uncharacterized protein (TIGR02271 family)
MSGQGQIHEGMEAYGTDDRLIGTIERVHGDGFDVAGFHYGRGTVVRVENDRAYVQGVGTREEVGASGATTRVAETAELATEGEIRVPVVEEQLQVGKREVDLGEIEIRRRVIEEEQVVPVTLRREEVTVSQVGAPERALRPGEEAFQEGTIRVAVRGEEAVVAKETVVTGEVVVNKDVTQEERTVTDTVRRTEVDFDDTYTQARADFEAHHATTGAQRAVFTDFEPYYQAGYTAGSDKRYTGRTFEEVEPDLRRDHEAHGGTGVWEELRERLRAGFDRARN